MLALRKSVQTMPRKNINTDATQERQYLRDEDVNAPRALAQSRVDRVDQ